MAQVAQIHQVMKNMKTCSKVSDVEPIKVVTDANEASCVYYMGTHLFEECSANYVSFNYVDNNKYNNPYNNTYSLGWCNHLKLLWSKTQNQLKPHAP